MTDRLKPCPFCGGEVYVSNEDCYGNVDDNYLVHCDECGLQLGFTNQFLDEVEAVKYWNTRKPMDRIVEQLEKRSNEEGAEWVRLQRSEEVKQVSNTDIHSYASSCYDDAIEIVKEEGNYET